MLLSHHTLQNYQKQKLEWNSQFFHNAQCVIHILMPKYGTLQEQRKTKIPYDCRKLRLSTLLFLWPDTGLAGQILGSNGYP